MRDRPVRVLELRSVRGTGGGPEKTILFGARGHDPSAAQVTVCYIRDARDAIFEIDRKAVEYDVDYVEITERHSFDRAVWHSLAALLSERRFDVVHSHDYKTDLLGWLAQRRFGVASMATAHGWTGHSVREQYIYYPAHKRLLARFRRVIAVSSDIKQELVAHGAHPAQVEVLLNGIDHRYFAREPERVSRARAAFGVTPDHMAIGSVGRLEPQKRYDLLIEAFKRITDSLPGVRLLIAGDGSERSRLQRLIDHHGLSDQCRLLGHINDVRFFHHALDLFVQSSDYEGTPNVVLEAMALETPVVATAVGGTAEICRPGEDGLIVDPGDVHGLAAAIAGTLRDRIGTAARTRTARRRVEESLSFERRLRRVEDVYAELTERVPA